MKEESSLARRLHEALVDASFDGILAFDRDCRYTVWNRAMERMTGLRRDQALGQRAFDLFPFLQETGEDQYFYEALAGRSAVAKARPYIVPETGQQGFFDGYYSPLRDAAGEVSGGVAVIRDITERKEVEEALRASEERYRAFIANSSEGIWRFELEQPVPTHLPPDEQIELCYRFGYLAECNDAMARMYGFARAAEINGARLGDLLVRSEPKNVAYLRAFIAAGYRLTDAKSVEADRAGRSRIFSNNLVGILKDGLIVRAWGTQRDITERQQADEALSHFSAIVESSDDAIIGKTLDGIITSWNRGAERIYGYTAGEVVGQHISLLVPAERPDEIPRILDRLKRGEQVDHYETERITKEGRRLNISLTISVIKNQEGQPVGASSIARDITDRKQAETELRRSRQQLEIILEGVAESITVQDHTGRLIYANEAAAKAIGYASAQELLTTPVPALLQKFEILNEAGEPFAREQLPGRVALKEGRSASATLRYRNKETGEDRWSMVMATPVFDEQGQTQLAVNIFHDITERKRAEEAQRFLAEASGALASSLDYQTTLSSVAQMAVPAICDWCAVEVIEDDQSVKRIAVAHKDPAKVRWAQEIHERYPSDMDAPRGLPNVLRTGQAEIYPEITDEMLVAAAVDDEHLRLLRGVGFTSVMIVPLTTHGRVVGALSFISAESGRRYGAEDLALAEDLARRASSAIENARLYRAAQEANRLKDEFLATLSHELRTPMTSILGWSHLLQTARFDAETVNRALDSINRNAKAQTQIIEDVLDVSRIITGKLRLEMRPLELAALVESALETIRPGATAKGIELQATLDETGGEITGDPARLQQVLWNLLSNAVKFTPRGGSIEVQLSYAEAQARITVSDTGQGINRKFLPHVFDRFSQADSSISRHHGGLGLGLAIVRHLVELHGGTVSADSAGAGMGATFTVALPLTGTARPTAAAHGAKQTDRQATATGASVPLDCSTSLEKLKVLVVDDEPDALLLLRTILESCGAEIEVAASVAEAMEMIERFQPDVLLSDIGMPGEDGYELIRRVRALPAERGGRIPAIALTAYAREEDRMRALLAGYHIHIAKPINPTELIAVVGSMAGLAGRNDN